MGLSKKVWLVLGLVLLAVLLSYQFRLYIYGFIYQPQMFSEPVLDTQLNDDEIPADLGEIGILSFSKTNGFRHHDAIAASRTLLDKLAEKNGWTVVHSENGAGFQSRILRRFHLIILNHKTGKTWTDAQRNAFREYIEAGGTVIAWHAAGDDSNHDWDWYQNYFLRADFTNHPMDQHIQQADLLVEDQSHPVTKNLPAVWSRADEWYNFAQSPRDNTNVLISIDENSYDPEKPQQEESEDDAGVAQEDTTKQDHPMVWWHRWGDGRIFYSALGHTEQSYTEPLYIQFVEDAINWGLN